MKTSDDDWLAGFGLMVIGALVGFVLGVFLMEKLGMDPLRDRVKELEEPKEETVKVEGTWV